MAIDIRAVRTDVPATQDRLFVNSAGSSLVPRQTAERVKAFLSEEAMLGGYQLMDTYHAEILEFYDEVAKLLSCKPRNIAFASSATDAYGKALSSIDFEPGDVILTTDDDYVSNYFQFMNLRDRRGIKIERMSLLPDGDIDLRGIESQLDKLNPKLVALAHVPTNSGLVQDATAVGRLVKERKALYLVDACQSVGQMVVDVHSLHADFLSVTGRKFMRGPRGTGFLYVADHLLEAGLRPIAMDGAGGQWDSATSYTLEPSAKRFEFWEKPYALLLGLKESVAYANNQGIANIEAYNQSLMRHLRSSLAAINGVQCYDKGSKGCNILSLRKVGADRDRVKAVLHASKVICGIGERSHAVIDYDKKGVDWIVRLSPHYFNTTEEMNRLAEIIDSI